MMKKLRPSTLTEGRVDEVHFNTRGTAKGVQIQDHLVETIQPIEKAGLEQQNTGLIHVKNLFPYFPVLDLLHARRVSPVVLTHKLAQSARYPDLLTSFAPSVRKSAIALFPYSPF